MRFTFISALMAAHAFAQDVTSSDNTRVFDPLLEIFQQNHEEGQQGILDNLPRISFSEVSDQQIQDWYSGKRAQTEAQIGKWDEIWKSYQRAIAQPWNDFLAEAEKLSAEDAKIGMQTDQERIRFISENTFIDGQSLITRFPEIEKFLTEYRTQADSVEFSFEKLQIPVHQPNTLTKLTTESGMDGGYLDQEGNYVANDEIYYDNQAFSEQVKDALSDALVSYGYDPDVAQEWLLKKGQTWQLLQQASNNDKAAQAKAHIAEAADAINRILENMIADLEGRQIENQAEDKAWLNKLKADIDTQAQANIDKVSQWIDKMYPAEPIETTDQVSFAKVDTEMTVLVEGISGEGPTSSIGFGTLAIGSAGILAYLYKKQNESKQTGNDDDEDYQRVVHDQLIEYQEHDEDFIRVEEDDFEDEPMQDNF